MGPLIFISEYPGQRPIRNPAGSGGVACSAPRVRVKNRVILCPNDLLAEGGRKGDREDGEKDWLSPIETEREREIGNFFWI